MRSAILRAMFGAVAAALACTSSLAGDAFPSRPVRLIVPVAAGGWGDLSTRLVGQKLSQELGQAVLVENRTGAGGLVGIRYVKSSPADGYTVVVTGGTMPIQAALSAEPGFDPLKDFIPVGAMVRSPAIIVVGANQPAHRLTDLMAQAKADPNKVSYASAGVGTTTHIAAEMLLRQTHLEMLHVPYKGNGAAMTDVISGRVAMMIDAYGSSAGNLAGGRMRAVAVTSTTRLKALPEVPTVIEQGVPGFTYYFWLGVFAPAGTPADVVKKLSASLTRTLNDPQLKERLQVDATEPMLMSQAEFGSYFRREVTDTNALVQALGIPKQ